jgi:hypothetical protein
LAESHKLDPHPLDESPRPESGKSRLNRHGTILDGKSDGLNQNKKGANWRAHDLKNQDTRQGPGQGPTQGINLLQMTPNWFLGIQTLNPI